MTLVKFGYPTFYRGRAEALTYNDVSITTKAETLPFLLQIHCKPF